MGEEFLPCYSGTLPNWPPSRLVDGRALAPALLTSSASPFSSQTGARSCVTSVSSSSSAAGRLHHQRRGGRLPPLQASLRRRRCSRARPQPPLGELRVALLDVLVDVVASPRRT